MRWRNRESVDRSPTAPDYSKWYKTWQLRAGRTDFTARIGSVQQTAGSGRAKQSTQPMQDLNAGRPSTYSCPYCTLKNALSRRIIRTSRKEGGGIFPYIQCDRYPCSVLVHSHTTKTATFTSVSEEWKERFARVFITLNFVRHWTMCLNKRKCCTTFAAGSWVYERHTLCPRVKVCTYSRCQIWHYPSRQSQHIIKYT